MFEELLLSLSQVLIIDKEVYILNTKGEFGRVDIGIFGIPSIRPIQKDTIITAIGKLPPEEKGVIIDFNAMNVSSAEMLRLLIKHIDGSSKITLT